MNHTATFLIVASAVTLLACGKTEEAAAPATEPPAAEAPETLPEPEVAAPVVETPSAALPATQPETPPEQPAAADTRAAAPASPAAAPAAPAPAAATAAPAADLARGEQIYRQACAFCHDKGVAGAPKTGDAAAWVPRLAQGMETLYAVAIRGKGAMPAKGGNPSLSDADVNAAVDYMIAHSR